MPSRREYFEASLKVLAEHGFTGLNVGALCRELGVTSGSFYHHFLGWPGFVTQLLEHWESRQLLGSPEDFAALMDLTLGLPHEAEAAIRAWALNDGSVRAVQERVDAARRRAVGKAVEGIVGDRALARTLTSLGMAMLVGHQQLASAGEHDELTELLAEYTRLVHSRAGG
ncbi:TetR/AcrR family transcriptional regulator [Amycolatopsis plumensis]|uniref:TetR/AcrR family transcriptional regulator n=1 Tax=Amycolatopsis plumensis TaxID=236508 RepID=A0ABV5UHU2_9PSEU